MYKKHTHTRARHNQESWQEENNNNVTKLKCEISNENTDKPWTCRHPNAQKIPDQFTESAPWSCWRGVCVRHLWVTDRKIGFGVNKTIANDNPRVQTIGAQPVPSSCSTVIRIANNADGLITHIIIAITTSPCRPIPYICYTVYGYIHSLSLSLYRYLCVYRAIYTPRNHFSFPHCLCQSVSLFGKEPFTHNLNRLAESQRQLLSNESSYAETKSIQK